MITYEDLSRNANTLLDFCEYPAVQYKVQFTILDVPYEDRGLSLLRKAFLKSDIVEECIRHRMLMEDGDHFNQKIIL